MIQKYRVFESYLDLQRKKLTKSQDIDYVLRELRSLDENFHPSQLITDKLLQIKQYFEEFNSHFTEKCKYYLKNQNEKAVDDLKREIIEKASVLKRTEYFTSKKPQLKRKHFFLA